MLQAIRSKVGSWVVKILFILLIVSFGVWGIGDFTRTVSADVATVGNEAISQADLDRVFRDEVNRLRQSLGPELTPAQARQLGILDQALERLIQQRLLALDAKEKGLRVGDVDVARTVAEFPAFKNAFGQFDPNLMRGLLLQAGMNEAMLIEQIKADLARQQSVQAIAAGAVTPTALAESIFRYRGERRVAEMVLIPTSAMPKPAAPDEATLRQFHQDESVRYTAPEYRTLTVALLTVDAVAAEIKVTDEELKEAYAARTAEFVKPELRTLVQVVAADQETAGKLAAAVAKGQTIEQAAQTVGLEAVQLDSTAKADLPGELAEPVFALAKGATSQPIRTALGWHVATVREIVPGGETPFEKARDQLLADVRKERAGDRLFEESNAMEDALAAGTPLEEAAAKVGARMVKLTQIDNRGMPAAGGAAADLPDLQAVMGTAFGLAEGATSTVAEAGDAGYYAVKVEQVTPAALKPFEGIRAQVLADWTLQQQTDTARKKAEEVAGKLRAGAAPAAVAKEVPGAVQSRTAALPRNPAQAQQLPLPRGVLTDLFGLAPNGVAVGEARDGMVVAKLVEIVPADTVAGASIITQVADNLRNTLANDLVTQYVAGLRQRHTVKINQTVLNSMYRDQ